MDQQATTDIGVLDQFQNEFVVCWRRVPNKTFFFVLLAAWLLLFQFLGNSILGYVKTHSLFVWMAEAYKGSETGNDDAHGKFIPLVVLALVWWKRKDLLRVNLRTWSPGLAILLAAIFLHVAGFVVQQPAVSIVAFYLGIYGLMGLTWGPQLLRATFFPYALFIFAVPLGARAEMITFPLRLFVSQIVEHICHGILMIDIVRDGNNLIDPGHRYQYEVAAACSGIRSLIAIGLMATVSAFLFFRTWWKRILLLMSAVPLAIIGNALRLLAIIVAANFFGKEWGDYVHEGGPFGIISLLPYAPAIFGLIWIVGKFEEKKIEQ
jgi:exosortase